MNALVDGVRTPIETLEAPWPRTDRRSAARLAEHAPQSSLDPSSIGDVLMVRQPGGEDKGTARMGALAGFLEVPGETVNRLCASGLAATRFPDVARRRCVRGGGRWGGAHDTRSLGHEQDEQSFWPRHDLDDKLG